MCVCVDVCVCVCARACECVSMRADVCVCVRARMRPCAHSSFFGYIPACMCSYVGVGGGRLAVGSALEAEELAQLARQLEEPARCV